MKSVPVSVRVSPEDAEFIASLKIEDAVTPSDKIRALIKRARLLESREKSYEGALSSFQAQFRAVLNQLAQHEDQENLHSELVRLFLDWLVEADAYAAAPPMTSDAKTRAADLKRFEYGVMERTLRLCETVIRLGITKVAPCYDPDIVSDNIDRVLDLSAVVSASRTRKEKSK